VFVFKSVLLELSVYIYMLVCKYILCVYIYIYVYTYVYSFVIDDCFCYLKQLSNTLA